MGLEIRQFIVNMESDLCYANEEELAQLIETKSRGIKKTENFFIKWYKYRSREYESLLFNASITKDIAYRIAYHIENVFDNVYNELKKDDSFFRKYEISLSELIFIYIFQVHIEHLDLFNLIRLLPEWLADLLDKEKIQIVIADNTLIIFKKYDTN